MKTLIALLLAFTLASGIAIAGQPVNVNTADAATLAESLDGVGASKAEAIIAYRDANGPFKDADQLVNVKGIGLKTLEKNRQYIQVGEAEKPARKSE